MREIRFRAWWQQNKQMVAIGMVTWKDGQIDRVMSECGGGFDYDELELMQFTGLKDKNGKNIYEGDIVKYTRQNWTADHNPKETLVDICTVYWSEDYRGFANDMRALDRRGEKGVGRCYSSGQLGFRDNRADENIIEVIGNVHENPELLEDIS